MTHFTIKNLSATYGTHPVLENINFSSEGSEIIGVIGANGAGKSTLLKAIAGLIPCQGEVQLKGEMLHTLEPRKRSLLCSYAGQVLTQTFSFRVGEIISMGLASRDRFYRPPKIPEKISQILHELGFEGSPNAFFSELSVGQQQIVMLAQVLLKDTQLILLDEPSAPLDYRHTAKMLLAIKKRAAAGALVLMAVHDLNLASQVCDRIIMLEDTHMSYAGTPHEILKKDILENAYKTQIDRFEHPHTKQPLIGLQL
jgi:iron complex transport system ATP-binding protein